MLQIKFNGQAVAESLLPPCIEREFVLEEERIPAQMAICVNLARLLRCNQLEELARVDKHRSVFTDDPFIVCIDDVAHLGQFLEVEINCPEGSDIHETKAHVDAFVYAKLKGVLAHFR